MVDVRAPWEGMTIAGGRYQQLATLGEGGMGYVYRALDGHLKTQVVIKSPRRALLEDAEQISRFEREVGAMIQLSYPHIVPVIDVGRHDGTPFAVMRYLAGGNLDDRMGIDAAGQQQPMSLESLEVWLPTIAKALDFVHQQKYLHRDVKPANILFDTHGHAYLSDFGIIKALGEQIEARTHKLTGDGFIVGTVDYMAPELLTGKPVDGRSDQYALAATVYQVLSGHLPFEGNSAAAIMVQHVNEQPRSLTALAAHVPASVGEAVVRGLAKNPRERYASCHAFAQAVMQAVALAGSAATHSPVAGQNAAAGAASRPQAAAGAAGVPQPTTAVQSATQVRSTKSAQPRPTARMPMLVQTPPPQLSTRRPAWMIAGIVAAVAAVGLGVAVLWPSSDSANDDEYEVLDQNPLPRLIAEWDERANKAEDALVVDSQPLRTQLEYANADELLQMLDAQAKRPPAALRGRLEALDHDLEQMRKTNEQLTDRLRSRLNEQFGRNSSQADQQRGQLILEQRGLQDQQSKLATMQRRLKVLEGSLDGPVTKKYDAGAIAEIAVLRELESASTANDHPQISAATRTRAHELLLAKNDKLASTALNALVRTGDLAATRSAGDRLAHGQAEGQPALCASLLMSGKSDSIATAAAFMKANPEAAQRLDVTRLLKYVQDNLRLYEPIVEPLVTLCKTSDERFRLVQVQTTSMTSIWAHEIEKACQTGLLKTRVDDIVGEILAHDRKSAFPLAKHLLEQHHDVKLAAISPDELERLISEDRDLAAQVMEQLLIQGTGPRRRAAIQAYRFATVPLNESTIRKRLEKEGASEPTALANELLSASDDRSLTLAEFVLVHVPGVEPGKLNYARVSKAALERDAIRTSLAGMSVHVPESGRLWALEQLLRPAFVDRFREIQAINGRQLADLKLITQVLNGKLKVVKGHAALSGTDRGLDVPAADLPRMKTELDPEAFATDGKFEASLAELRGQLSKIKTSSDAQFAPDLAQIDQYLAEMQDLTKVGLVLAKIYDFTVAQQIPGARREIQKKRLDTWSFRFTRGNIETFERESPVYEAAEKALAADRALLPAFLLKPVGPPGGKVSTSDRQP